MKLLVCLAVFCFLLNIRSAMGWVAHWPWQCQGLTCDCKGKKSWQDEYCARGFRFHGCYRSKCWAQCDYGGSRWCYSGKLYHGPSPVHCNSSQPDVGSVMPCSEKAKLNHWVRELRIFHCLQVRFSLDYRGFGRECSRLLTGVWFFFSQVFFFS